MALKEGVFYCDNCGVSVPKDKINASILPWKDGEATKTSEYCDECLIKFEKEFCKKIPSFYH